MAERLNHLTALVEDLSLRSVSGRLARLLLENAQDGVLPRARWHTQAELAARLGTVPHMVGRALRRLVEQGYIEVERQQFRILDSAGLQREADGQRKSAKPPIQQVDKSRRKLLRTAHVGGAAGSNRAGRLSARRSDDWTERQRHDNRSQPGSQAQQRGTQGPLRRGAHYAIGGTFRAGRDPARHVRSEPGLGQEAGQVAAAVIDGGSQAVTNVLLSRWLEVQDYRLVPVGLVANVEDGIVALDITAAEVDTLRVREPS